MAVPEISLHLDASDLKNDCLASLPRTVELIYEGDKLLRPWGKSESQESSLPWEDGVSVFFFFLTRLIVPHTLNFVMVSFGEF